MHPQLPGGNRGEETRNVILAVVVSIAILIGFDFLYVAPQRAAIQEQQRNATDITDETDTTTPQLPTLEPSITTGVGAARDDADSTESTESILSSSARVAIEGGGVLGSLSLRGAILDDLSLRQYREYNEVDSPLVALLRPDGAEHPFFVHLGWSAAEGVALPDQNSNWQQVRGGSLTPESPITLAWDNGEGLRFEQEWQIEDRFFFHVKQRVINQGDEAVEMAPWALIARVDPPPGLGFFILHEGPIAWLDQKLQEPSYEDLEGGTPLVFDDAARGWLGFTDKYWMAAIIAGEGGRARFLESSTEGGLRYQADLVRAAHRVGAGEVYESVERIFAGAKEVRQLDALSEAHGIDRFDLAVDFGWLYFLTKPLFYGLDWFNRLTGNFGVAILLITVVMRLLFFPLANNSFRTMAKMRKIQPQVAALREQHGQDRQQMQKEMMALYRTERVNPLAGCLPILLQIPVFFALYKVLFVTIEMRHAPFYGWIRDLSAPDPTTWINLFGLLPFDRPVLGLFDILQIGVGPLLMGLTMMVQMRLNPPPPDPVQAKIFAWMPVMFTFFLASFPAGLIVYWTWNNTLSILQQSIIMKRAGVPVEFHLPGRGLLRKWGSGGKARNAGKADGDGSDSNDDSKGGGDGGRKG